MPLKSKGPRLPRSVRKRNTRALGHRLDLESNTQHKGTCLQKRSRLMDTRTDLWLPRSRGSGMDWGLGVSRCKLLH